MWTVTMRHEKVTMHLLLLLGEWSRFGSLTKVKRSHRQFIELHTSTNKYCHTSLAVWFPQRSY